MATLIGGGGAFAAAKPDPAPQRKVPRAVKQLWSEYPLHAGRSGRTQQPVARVQIPRSSAAPSDDGGTAPTSVFLATAVTMLGLSIALLLLFRERVRAISLRGLSPRRLAFPTFALTRPDTGPRIRSGLKGGQTMSYFRRRRGSGSDRQHREPSRDAESSAKRLAAYSLHASGETTPDRSTETQAGGKRSHQPGQTARVVEPAPRSPNDPAVYEQLGEHVSTVLSSADEAAKRLQATAKKEAERIRGEAEDYGRKTRAAADAYAEERRASAETQASAITADAEKRARELRSAAEEQATAIQRDGIRRREALFQETERSEERLRNLLTVFRAMTERLENLVTTGGSRGTETAQTSVDDDLTEALAESRGSTSAGSRAGDSRARR